MEEFTRTVLGETGAGKSYQVKFSQRAERGGVSFPLRVSLRSDPAHMELEFDWTEVQVNEVADPRLFEFEPPRGAKIVELDDGDAG